MEYEITLGTTLLLATFYCWTSRLNTLFFFGRTASEEFRSSEHGKAITRQYLTGIGLATVAAVVLAWLGHHAGIRGLAFSGPLMLFVGASIVFARANGAARRLAPGADAGAREPLVQVALLEQPTYWIPGLGAVLLPPAVCVATVAVAVLTAAHGAGIKAGWDAFTSSMDGRGDSGLLGLATGMMTAATLQLLVFRTSVRLRTRMAQYSVRACITLEWVAAALLVATIVATRLGVVISRSVEQGAIGGGLVAAVAVALWNHARSKKFVPPPVEVGGDDRWRWGLFYVDRNDPALLVQSRCGAGYTLNYGRIAAWPISLGLVAYLVGVLFFLPHHG